MNLVPMKTTSGLLFSVRESSARSNWTFQLHCTLCRALNNLPPNRHNASPCVPNPQPTRGGSRSIFFPYVAHKTDRLFIRYFWTAPCSSLPTQAEGRTLSRYEVNCIIREHENAIVLDEAKGTRCEVNQLASNRPIEDQLFMTRSTLQERDILFGVIDGHSGPVCGKVVRQRLPYYLHSALCAKHLRDVDGTEQPWSPVDIVDNLLGSSPPSGAPWVNNLNTFISDLVKDNSSNDTLSYTARLKRLFLRSSKDDDGSSTSPYDDVRETIKSTVKQLDLDITKEIKDMAKNDDLYGEGRALASSGCCALIAYLMEEDLFIANVGDCRAVLGSCEDGSWTAQHLSNDHSCAANSAEVTRIIKEHPPNEGRTCIRNSRLLGVLQPLRALGDIQLKLTREELKKIFSYIPGYKPPKDLHTPPYLTAEPEVHHYKIEPRDKFIVLATDGLWDILSNEDVVSAVAAYMEGRKVQMFKDKARLLGISNAKDAFNDMEDENVASFLIRYALEGYDEENLRGQLTLPYPDVRYYRDDITVIVLFLEDYLAGN